MRRRRRRRVRRAAGLHRPSRCDVGRDIKHQHHHVRPGYDHHDDDVYIAANDLHNKYDDVDFDHNDDHNYNDHDDDRT